MDFFNCVFGFVVVIITWNPFNGHDAPPDRYYSSSLDYVLALGGKY